MMRVGDIVFRKRQGRIWNETTRLDKSQVGLVIEELKERNEVAQYRVKFNEKALWFYQHDLEKIPTSGNGERD